MLPICTACGRYVRTFTSRASDANCPFCGAHLQTAEPGLRLPSAASIALGLSLATLDACFVPVAKYGVAPMDDTFVDSGQDTSGVDNDGDHYYAASDGGTDCNDADPAIHPGATETPNDGVDSNCDGGDNT